MKQRCRLSWVVWSAGLFSACGAASDGVGLDGVTFADGQRLVARRFEYPGAPSLFFRIYDQQMGVDCAFAVAADGRLRCLPGGESYDRPEAPTAWVEGNVRAGKTNLSRLQPSQVWSSDGGRFPYPYPSSLFDEVTMRACEAGLSFDVDGSGSGTCGDLTLAIVPRGSGRLAAQTLVFDDHDVATVFFDNPDQPTASLGAYLDRDRGTTCRPTWTVDQGVRCVPAGAVAVSEPVDSFADSDCSIPAVYGTTVVMLAPVGADGRARASAIRGAGAMLEATRYERSLGLCMATLANGNAFALGDVIPWSAFARLDAFVGARTDR